MFAEAFLQSRPLCWALTPHLWPEYMLFAPCVEPRLIATLHCVLDRLESAVDEANLTRNLNSPGWSGHRQTHNTNTTTTTSDGIHIN